MSGVSFQPRWWIEAVLVLQSPLVIRTGEAEERPAREGEDAEPGTVAQVERDVRGQPYIPGTSLKGAIRAWAVRRLPSAADRIEALFGHDPRRIGEDQEAGGGDESRQQGLGGRAEFHDAFLADVSDKEACHRPDHEGEEAPEKPKLPEAGSTAIDRRTGTAARQKLRFTELVPKGRRFRLVVTGDGLEARDVGLLLAAFDAFGRGEITLGGDVGSGKGRARIDDVSLRRLDATDVAKWLQAMAPGVWWECIREAEPLAKQQIQQPTPAEDVPAIQVCLELAFDGPFLVSERNRGKKGEAEADLVPTRAGYDVAVLPGESVKGALRAQAERIARTVHNLDDEAEHASVRRLFGPRAGGEALRRGALAVSDFLPCNEPQERQQELVAIDRFTGGAAAGAKFSIRHLESPRLAGSLSLRLRPPEWRKASGKRAGEIDRDALKVRTEDLGLLALLLRDLAEGDITFGYGASKGYGACRIAKVVVSYVNRPEVEQVLRALSGASLPNLPEGEPDLPTLKGFGCAIAGCIEAFGKASA